MCQECGFDPEKHKVISSDTMFIHQDEDGSPTIGMHRAQDYIWMEYEEVQKLPIELRQAACIAIISDHLNWAYALTEGSIDLNLIIQEAKLMSEAYILQVSEKVGKKLKESLERLAETLTGPEADAHLN